MELSVNMSSFGEFRDHLPHTSPQLAFFWRKATAGVNQQQYSLQLVVSGFGSGQLMEPTAATLMSVRVYEAIQERTSSLSTQSQVHVQFKSFLKYLFSACVGPKQVRHKVNLLSGCLFIILQSIKLEQIGKKWNLKTASEPIHVSRHVQWKLRLFAH